MSALRKPKEKPSNFIRAIKEWLSGDMTGHLGAYMYTDDRDDHRWKDGHSAETYYLGRDDKATFDLVLKDLDIAVSNIYDLGPGGQASVQQKSIPLIKAVGAQEYYPIDLAPTLSGSASDLVRNTVCIGGEPVIADFFSPIAMTKPDALLAFLGGTLGNIETHADAASLQKRLTKIFFNYREMVSQKSYMLVSFDANTNVEEILSCYRSEQFDSLIHSCVDRAIDTSNFDYDVTWTSNNYQLALGLRAKHDRIVKFEGEEFAIEQGEFLPVLNSYRYPVDFVKEAAVKAAWTHEKTWSATGKVHYLLFSC